MLCVMRDPNEEALCGKKKKMLAEADVKYVHRLTPNKRGHPLALFRLGRVLWTFLIYIWRFSFRPLKWPGVSICLSKAPPFFSHFMDF